jgi:hypothetical protein
MQAGVARSRVTSTVLMRSAISSLLTILAVSNLVDYGTLHSGAATEPTLGDNAYRARSVLPLHIRTVADHTVDHRRLDVRDALLRMAEILRWIAPSILAKDFDAHSASRVICLGLNTAANWSASAPSANAM